MKTIVITVGKELLTGRSINTNLATIAQKLLTVGIEIDRSYVIDDDPVEYKHILDNTDADMIIITGGLGPTIDDITKEVVFDYYNVDTIVDEDILEQIESYFKRRSQKMTEANHKQARTPKDGIVLTNNRGTAPGVYFTVDHKRVVLFPGPPHEMKPMLDQVIDILTKELDIKQFSKGYKLVGIGESTLEADMQEFYTMHNDVRVNPYASMGEIKYILSSSNKEALDTVADKFKNRFSEYIYGDLSDTLEGVVVQLLKQHNKTLSLAESCTGGMIASRIVNVSGASDVFSESFVTYSNDAKKKYLNVTDDTLAKKGAVSERCAREMVDGLLKTTQSTVGLSVTGIAGPTGGTKEKPVGLVYFALKIDNHITVEKQVFNGTRDMVRHRATQYALNMIRKGLKE